MPPSENSQLFLRYSNEAICQFPEQGAATLSTYRPMSEYLPKVIPLQLRPTHHHVMHFIGAIGKAEIAQVGVHGGQW